MIDRTTARYALSNNESNALDWLDSHGFDGTFISQNLTNSIVHVEKGGFCGDIEIPTLATLSINDLIRRITDSISLLEDDLGV